MNNIVLIQFSSREGGNSFHIAEYIKSHYKKDAIQVFLADASKIQPCGQCNYECLTVGKSCPNLTSDLTNLITNLMDSICNADLVYFIVPNYCGFPCASYFAFNERSVGYFNMDRQLMQKYMEVPKRFIIISNLESESFVTAMKQQTNYKPDILYLKSGKYEKRSTAGDILESETAQADLAAYLNRYHP